MSYSRAQVVDMAKIIIKIFWVVWICFNLQSKETLSHFLVTKGALDVWRRNEILLFIVFTNFPDAGLAGAAKLPLKTVFPAPQCFT